MKRLVIVIIIVLVILAAGALVFMRHPDSTSYDGLHPLLTPPSAPTRDLPPGTSEYHNERYGFSFLYPKSASLKTLNQGLGAMTILIEDDAAGQGFQLFIVPYTETTITDERFRKDEPSGVRKNAVAATVDGVPATVFESEDAALGETYEVWFIHGGYLFEATTAKPLASWLGSILSTWQFSGT
jgi:hypothetical protein